MISLNQIKFTCIGIVLVLLSGICSIAIAGYEIEYQHAYSTNPVEDSVLVRRGPYSSAPIFALIDKNDKVTVYASNGIYKKVKLQSGSKKGQMGYVESSDLWAQGYPKKPSPKPSQHNSQGFRNTTDYTAIVTASKLRIRSGPGTNYRIYTRRLIRGERVKVTHTKRGTTWVRIAFRDKLAAYVSGKYLMRAPDKPVAVSAPPASASCKVVSLRSGIVENTGKPIFGELNDLVRSDLLTVGEFSMKGGDRWYGRGKNESARIVWERKYTDKNVSVGVYGRDGARFLVNDGYTGDIFNHIDINGRYFHLLTGATGRGTPVRCTVEIPILMITPYGPVGSGCPNGKYQISKISSSTGEMFANESELLHCPRGAVPRNLQLFQQCGVYDSSTDSTIRCPNF